MIVSAIRVLKVLPSGQLAVGALVMIATIAVLAPMLLRDAATSFELSRSSQGPSPAHWAGTDELGRDILARVLVATRPSVLLALAATGLGAMVGLPFGLALAMAGGRGQAIGARAIEVFFAFPIILIAVLVTATLGPSAESAVFAIGFALAAHFARFGHTLAASIVAQDFVANAIVAGISRRRLLTRYVFPNIAEPVVITVSHVVVVSLLAVSSLSFLGLGVQPPGFDWGRMLVEGVRSFYSVPTAALAPAAAIAITGLVIGLSGEALARLLNPQLWAS